MSHPRVGPAPPPAQRAEFILYWHSTYRDDKRYWRRDLVNYQGLLWRLVTPTEKGVAPPTLATTKVPHWEFVARADPSLGGGGGSMTGAEIEGVLDAYYGDTLWRDPVLPTNLSVTNKTGTTYDVASSTGSDATLPAATDTEAGLFTATNKVKLDGIEAGADVNVGTDLAITNYNNTGLDLESSTGNDVHLGLATSAGGTNKAGLMSPDQYDKLNGIEAGAEVNDPTNLSVANKTSTSFDVASSTGTDATLPAVSGTEAGLMTAAQFTKLAGIEAGAQVNVGTDLSISNHDADGLDINSSTGADISLGLATGLAGGNEAGLMAPSQVDLLDSFTTFGENIVAAADAAAGRDVLLLRKQLNSDTTFYVRTGGSDTPTREALVDDDAHAWQTLQFAYDYLTRYVDPAGHSMTVQVQDGTYAGGLQANSHWWGGTGIIFQGNVASPENCIINGGSNCAFRADYAQIAVKGFTVKSTSQDGLSAIGMGKIDVTGAMKFDDCAGAHMAAMMGGLIHVVADYEVIGDAYAHVSIDSNATIRNDISTATFTGTPTFTAFALVSNGGRLMAAGPTGTGINWSGAVSATYKAIISGGGEIFTNGQGLTDLPGTGGPLIQGSSTYDDVVGAPACTATGEILFNDAGITSSDADLFWDNTDKLLGIGTNTPSAKLHTVASAGDVNTYFTGGVNLFYPSSSSPSQGMMFDISGMANGSNGMFFSMPSGWTGNIFSANLDVDQVFSISYRGEAFVKYGLHVGSIASTNTLDIVGSVSFGAPVTKTANFTVGAAENDIINNKSGSSCTATLPTASAWMGRRIRFKNIQAQTLVSNASNVCPRGSATPGTAMLAATAGAWCEIVSDGTNWVIMAAA